MKHLKATFFLVVVLAVATAGFLQLFHEEAFAGCQPCTANLCATTCSLSTCCNDCNGHNTNCNYWCHNCEL